MKQKGRKSAAQLSVIKTESLPHPTVPDDLLPEERDLWESIVKPRGADFFDDATLPLLSEYCRLTTQVKTMAFQIEQFEDDWLVTDDGVKRYKNLAGIRDQAQGRMIALARTMRLTQQARFVPDKAGNKPGRKTSGSKVWQRES